jgi:cell fate regulator YaaT (PSP1 superfamily)
MSTTTVAAMKVAPLRDVVRAGLPALVDMFSPTKNPCVVKVTPMKGASSAKRFRFDPYRASVLSAAAASPAKSIQSPCNISSQFTMMPTATVHHPAMMFSNYVAPQAVLPMAPTAAYYAPQQPLYSAPVVCDFAHEQKMIPSVIAPLPAVSHDEYYTTTAATTSSVRTASPIDVDVEDTRSCSVKSCSSSTASTQAPAPKIHYAVVRFKHDNYPYIAPFRIAEGDYVVVEGDRGENIGIVDTITTVKPDRPVASKVLRKATAHDLQIHEDLRRKEDVATKFCETAAKEIGINMTIMDTEYQFDQGKLSIFFKSKGVIDFRRLQRVLFREFRCRVWLVNWNEIQGSMKKH